MSVSLSVAGITDGFLHGINRVRFDEEPGMDEAYIQVTLDKTELAD